MHPRTGQDFAVRVNIGFRLPVEYGLVWPEQLPGEHLNVRLRTAVDCRPAENRSARRCRCGTNPPSPRAVFSRSIFFFFYCRCSLRSLDRTQQFQTRFISRELLDRVMEWDNLNKTPLIRFC